MEPFCGAPARCGPPAKTRKRTTGWKERRCSVLLSRRSTHTITHARRRTQHNCCSGRGGRAEGFFFGVYLYVRFASAPDKTQATQPNNNTGRARLFAGLAAPYAIRSRSAVCGARGVYSLFTASFSRRIQIVRRVTLASAERTYTSTNRCICIYMLACILHKATGSKLYSCKRRVGCGFRTCRDRRDFARRQNGGSRLRTMREENACVIHAKQQREAMKTASIARFGFSAEIPTKFLEMFQQKTGGNGGLHLLCAAIN